MLKSTNKMGKIIRGGYGPANLVGLAILVCLTALPSTACSPGEPAGRPEGEQAQQESSQTEQIDLEITSVAFQNGGTIPIKYTCYGQDISPELSWTGVPEGTKSFALIVDSPHAPLGSFTYWVIFNIPADTFELAEAVPATPELPGGVLQGKNDFGMIRYGGACPLWDTLHYYHFVLYALDRILNVPAGANRVQVDSAVQGHILAQAELTVDYSH